MQAVVDPVCKPPASRFASGVGFESGPGSHRRKSEGHSGDMAQDLKKARMPRVTDMVPGSLGGTSKQLMEGISKPMSGSLSLGFGVASGGKAEGSSELGRLVKPLKEDPEFPEPVYRLMRCSSVVGSFCEYIQVINVMCMPGSAFYLQFMPCTQLRRF